LVAVLMMRKKNSIGETLRMPVEKTLFVFPETERRKILVVPAIHPAEGVNSVMANGLDLRGSEHIPERTTSIYRKERRI